MNPDIFMSRIKKIAKSAAHAFIIAFVFFWVAACAIPFSGENTVNVFNNTVRLRVVANSDSADDQQLKLNVRNDIIGVAADIFKDCKTMDDAAYAVEKNRGLLLYTARKSVKNHGSDMPVSVSFGMEKCPVRRYSEFTFPAGEYLTLRINLGKAEGENWWCVMYPPLCVSAATNDVYADTETFLNYGFSEAEVEKLRKPQVKLAVFEFFEELLDN